jgi:hypothetical protein
MFKEMRRDILAEEVKRAGLEISPGKAQLALELRPELGPALDKLGITRPCCRAHTMAQVEYHEYY